MAGYKIICDTDVVIDYWDNTKPRHLSTRNIIDNTIGLNNIALSSITQIELLIGAFNKTELFKINQACRRFDIISLDDISTTVAVQLIFDYSLSHGLALADSLIAATAIISGNKLFTYNLKDYRFIKGLDLYI